MKKVMLILSVMLMSCLGCITIPDIFEPDTPDPDPVPDPIVTNAIPEHLKNQPPDDWTGDSTSNVLYLKYIANDGKGCILFPKWIKGRDVQSVTIGGQKTRRPYYPVLNDNGTYRNGGRLHARLHQPGATYGICVIIVKYHNGTEQSFQVGAKNHRDGYKKKY